MSFKNRPKDFIVNRPKKYSDDKTVADAQKDGVVHRLKKSFGSSDRGFSLPIVLASLVVAAVVAISYFS